MPSITITSEEEFQQHISSGKVVAVDFFGTWCGPCKFIAPIYEKMSGTYPQAVFLKVDIDQFEALSEREDIQTIPTFQVYSDGKKQSHIVGSEHIAQVGAKVKELLG